MIYHFFLLSLTAALISFTLRDTPDNNAITLDNSAITLIKTLTLKDSECHILSRLFAQSKYSVNHFSQLNSNVSKDKVLTY